MVAKKGVGPEFRLQEKHHQEIYCILGQTVQQKEFSRMMKVTTTVLTMVVVEDNVTKRAEVGTATTKPHQEVEGMIWNRITKAVTLCR
jgi:hypothetical protein